MSSPEPARPLRIAVIGSGISGLSAAWLLAGAHDVTLYEAENRLGGHSNTVIAETAHGPVPVDTGFIVFNESTYPNLTALLKTLDIGTIPTEMSFAVSLDQGRLEYAGTNLNGLFVQRLNIFNPRFHDMIRDLLRFYRQAPRDIGNLGLATLESYLDDNGYGDAFRQDHLYPMAAAIWSTPASSIGTYPARSFIRFCENHGLLQLTGRPLWRTVAGGSRAYVAAMRATIGKSIHTGLPVRSVLRHAAGVTVVDADGGSRHFDRVILACHADQALKLLASPTEAEKRILGTFRYTVNEAILHSDETLMPRRRKAWCSWNYLADRANPTDLCVTYWMNRLQAIDEKTPLFVTLNPPEDPRADSIYRRETYEHPLFDHEAVKAQEHLWSLQGQGGVWFAGAYFGAGFHEDGLQAGLAVAEAQGGVRRPWTVPGESARIHIPSVATPAILPAEAA